MIRAKGKEFYTLTYKSSGKDLTIATEFAYLFILWFAQNVNWAWAWLNVLVTDVNLEFKVILGKYKKK